MKKIICDRCENEIKEGGAELEIAIQEHPVWINNKGIRMKIEFYREGQGHKAEKPDLCRLCLEVTSKEGLKKMWEPRWSWE